MLHLFTHRCIFVPFAVDDLISTYRSLWFFGLILLFLPTVPLVFGLGDDYVSIPPIPSLQLCVCVCVCVESTASTPEISIFGVQRLLHRGRHAILVQQCECILASIFMCVLLSKRMKKGFLQSMNPRLCFSSSSCSSVLCLLFYINDPWKNKGRRLFTRQAYAQTV